MKENIFMHLVQKLLPSLLSGTAALLLAAAAQAGGYPHYLQNGIECGNCHNVHGSQPNLIWEQAAQQDIDHTSMNQLCWSCHNDADAVAVATHSSQQASAKYGNWTVECVACHEPHFQLQGSVFQGTVASADATTITRSGAADWTPDAFRGMIVFPDRNRTDASYLIAGNTADTLTVDPDVTTPQVDGAMEPGLVNAGDTFVISYGKLIRNQVDLGRIAEYASTAMPLPDPAYPKSGLRQVRFNRPTGADSFADGDTAYTGICEVCHTQTTHWRNDGTLAGIGVHAGLDGSDCTLCHRHTDGFAPYDHLAQGVVTLSTDCTGCHETVNPVVDVHANNCGLCHANGIGAGPLVEPYETDVPSGGECMDCHSLVTGAHDEVSHAASPPQDLVLIYAEGDHDDAMEWDGEVLVDCSRCHTSNLKAAHAQLCARCHPSPADTLTPSWNGGCQQGGCHTSYHTESNIAHYPYDDPAYCTQCHSADWSVPQTMCSNCHAYPGNGPPVTGSDAQASYTGTARINFSVTIDGKVGVGFTFYILDGGTTETGSDVTVSAPGSHTLEFWTVDQSGRVETPHKSTNFTITGDTDPPVTTSNAQTTYWHNAWITLSATDNGDLGVKATYYRLDGGPVQTGTVVHVPGVTGTVAHTLDFWSEDWSGNVEPVNTVNFTVTAGTATLRLIWGDSDTSGPPSHPDDWAAWEVRRGGYSGTLVASGSAAVTPDEGWTGINDVVVPVYPTPYHVSIDWWDSHFGWDDNTTFPEVYATTPGEIIELRY